jgi:hypothetical protein
MAKKSSYGIIVEPNGYILLPKSSSSCKVLTMTVNTGPADTGGPALQRQSDSLSQNKLQRLPAVGTIR